MRENNTKRICHISSSHYVFSVRIFHKETKTLLKKGYHVSLIIQNDKNEVIDGIQIIALPKPRNRFERVTKVAWRSFRLALKEKADVYHFHDPELIPIGLALKLLGKKVIYDVHELVYFQIADKPWLKFRIVKRLAQWFYLLFEDLSARFFDRLILAEDDYENYYKQAHKTFRNYTIIRNFPILSLVDDASATSQIDKQKPVIIYAGGLGEARGIKEIIQSIELVKDKAELQLLGIWESEEFKKECENLEGWKSTKFLGLVPLTKVYDYMKAADIGISILHPIKNYMTSLPVKAFEYMACSLPMVMSNFPYWQDIFGECAVFADSYSPEEIADRILYLLDNPDKAKQLGDRGRRLTEEKYSWEQESQKLTGLYDNLLK